MNTRFKISTRCTFAALMAMSASQVSVSFAADLEVIAEPVIIAQAKVGINLNEVPRVTVMTVDAADASGSLRWNTTDIINSIDMDKVFGSAMSNATIHTMPNTKSIKNSPYSAEVVSTKIQTLSDGNTITKTTKSMAYRDSAGRTRQETRDDKNEPRSIIINDAVENTRYVLSPFNKTATKISFDKGIFKRMEELRTENQKDKPNIVTMTDGKTVSARAIKDGETTTSIYNDGTKIVRQMVTIGMPKNGDLSFPGDVSRFKNNASTRDLGTKSIDGVVATGKITSYLIPAGVIGNSSPIIVSSETWFSPDLQITVYSKHSDPRSGDTIYKLNNLQRTEQPISLFAVPTEYAVKDMHNIMLRNNDSK